MLDSSILGDWDISELDVSCSLLAVSLTVL